MPVLETVVDVGGTLVRGGVQEAEQLALAVVLVGVHHDAVGVQLLQRRVFLHRDCVIYSAISYSVLSVLYYL